MRRAQHMPPGCITKRITTIKGRLHQEIHVHSGNVKAQVDAIEVERAAAYAKGITMNAFVIE